MSRVAIAAWASASIVAATAGVVPVLSRDTAAAQQSGHRRLVEAPACAHGRPQPPVTHPSGSGAQEVFVRVPAAAIVHVNAAGRVVSARTNTGCAPRRGDDVYVARDDGTLMLTPSFDVGRIEWQGDFRTAGVDQAQS